MSRREIKILLVDDEPDILEILAYNLKKVGYEVITGSNGLEAVSLAFKHIPALIVLDVMMPEMDGIEACEQIRKIPNLNNCVIAFLTARDEDYSLMAGFTAGADDYITKPIKPNLFVTKIKSLLRRQSSGQTKGENSYRIQDLVIFIEEYKVVQNNVEYSLPKKEFELLALLSSKPGAVFSRDEIVDKVWKGALVGGRSIDVHIRKLREKFGEDKFKTVKGVGYKILP